MVDGDTDLAEAVTHKTILETRNDGRTVSKRVWIPIDSPSEKITTVEKPADMPRMDCEPANVSPPPERTHPHRVGIQLKEASHGY
jgi:hypothetical protein